MLMVLLKDVTRFVEKHTLMCGVPGDSNGRADDVLVQFFLMHVSQDIPVFGLHSGVGTTRLWGSICDPLGIFWLGHRFQSTQDAVCAREQLPRGENRQDKASIANYCT